MCYGWFREKSSHVDNYVKNYSNYIVSVKPEWISEAMKFRLEWKDRKVSVPDCASYVMAKRLGIKFLTGDKEFEKLENFEFVK